MSAARPRFPVESVRARVATFGDRWAGFGSHRFDALVDDVAMISCVRDVARDRVGTMPARANMHEGSLHDFARNDSMKGTTA